MANLPGLFTYANQPTTTVSNGGTSAPASGTSEQWTVASGASFPAASTSSTPATFFAVADTAATSEVVLVTAATTVSPWVWGVTRGAENTTPVAHTSGFTVMQVVSAGSLNNFKQASNAVTTPMTVSNTTVETVVCTYQPISNDLEPGTVFEIVATGSIQTAATAGTLTWNLRWGGLTGTSVLSMVTGTKCPALVASIASGSSFDVNGTVTLTSATAAVGNINAWWQNTTTTYTGVASSATATTISGSGPLVLTAKFSTASTSEALVIPAPLIYRAA